MPRPASDREAIEAEIAHVRSLGLDELHTLWRLTFRSAPPPAFTKDLMARFLCWDIQERAFGGLDPETAKHLDGLAQGNKPGMDRPRRLKPGTVLLREYQGERHTVTVVPNGYFWHETTYASLSITARAITEAPDKRGVVMTKIIAPKCPGPKKGFFDRGLVPCIAFDHAPGGAVAPYEE